MISVALRGCACACGHRLVASRYHGGRRSSQLDGEPKQKAAQAWNVAMPCPTAPGLFSREGWGVGTLYRWCTSAYQQHVGRLCSCKSSNPIRLLMLAAASSRAFTKGKWILREITISVYSLRTSRTECDKEKMTWRGRT